MKKLLLALMAGLLIAPASQAQLSQNIAPRSFHQKVRLQQEVPVMQMPQVDVETLLAEDEINHATKVGPYRFGETIEMDIEFHNAGVWESLPNGDRIWRLDISSPGAYSLNFMFNEFYMPKGAMLHIYNQDGLNRLGAFTSANNRSDKEFATFMLAGEQAIIEYFEPHEVHGQGTLGVSHVVHAYRDVLSGMDSNRAGGSGACNNNVACPEGIPWENEINASTRILMGGGMCSGALIVDVPQSATPYYLTADHCIQGAGNGGTWVFNFNYQASTCGGSSAPNNQSLTGCSIRANNSGSDFALLELDNDPPVGYGVFFAGWDNSGSAPSSQVCVHHPSGDIKKISFDNDAATTANYAGAACWQIGDWEDGTTEGGSSGSPLFDQNHRIIGQLYGGQASCSNNVNDFYGRFETSWDGSSSSTRLRDWLDPNNTGATTMDGFDPNAPQVTVDAGAQALAGITEGEILCATEVTPLLTIKNSGQNNLTSATINWEIDNVAQTPYNWTGNLSTNQTDVITFPTQTFAAGSHSLEFAIANANGGADQNSNNDDISAAFTIVDGDEIEVNILTDNYGSETTWEITDASSNVVASGGGYADGGSTLYNELACLADGCYTFTIYDAYGDGICCQFGNGNYELLSPGGDEMGSGGEFNDDESVSFCLPFAVETPVAAFTVQTTEICAGDNITFTNTSTPSNATFAWTFESGSPGSSNNQNPSITYNSAGTFDVELTVTNSAGNDTHTMTNYITVNPSPSASTSSTGENLWTGGDNGTATVVASGGTPPYTYSWSEPGVGDNTTATGLSAGSYTVTVTDDEGCQATSTVTVGNNVGINDLELAEAISIYPNPTSGALNVEFPLESNIIDITVSDVIGRTISKINVVGLERTTIDFNGMAEGIYHLNFLAVDKKATKKVVHLKN